MVIKYHQSHKKLQPAVVPFYDTTKNNPNLVIIDHKIGVFHCVG